MMEAVAATTSGETIEEYIDKLNDATSLEAGAAVHRQPPRQIRWGTILFSALSSFLKVYIGQRTFLDGVDGFLVARLTAIYTLAANAKLWEYRMREKEGKGVFPPTTHAEIEQLRSQHHS